MDYLQKFAGQVRSRLAIAFLVNNLLIIGGWYLAANVFHLSGWQFWTVLLIIPIITIVIWPLIMTSTLLQPLRLIWQAILHVSPTTDSSTGAPEIDRLRLGRELVTNLTSQIYQLASVVGEIESTKRKAPEDLHSSFLANALPLPMTVLDKEEKIVFVNDALCKYIKRGADELIGQNVYTILDMSFSSHDTFDKWLNESKQNAATADHSWERVRLGLADESNALQFDLAAHYNKGNPSGFETLLVFFDHTQQYSQDDQAMGFVALSVHELRAPLTLLRGYIEVFDEELGPNLNSELKGFMGKMDAAGQQLAGFVDNILNVAKIEDNQLTLQLREENWPSIIDSVVSDMRLRAKVRGLELKTDIQGDLPTVGVDRYSIYEVLANLIDNAIKYSKTSKEIFVTSKLNSDGLVETSVKDFGLGIDASVLPHIFDKFYRSHRNRAQIGGTGLGLYLAKSIVDALGGQIWVSSKVDEGSNFTFTIIPFAQLAGEQKDGTSGSVSRGAHGWIKNHSLYRD
ncbi:MAG: PAS domain-containing sensor histidine kinase [Candidatus Saccharimonadales bacterium]